jgi:hypothetical protein
MNYPDRIELVLTYNHDSEDTEPFTERVDAEKFGDYYRLVHLPLLLRILHTETF